ncbi:MAG: OmpA family protein [Proteobacteria bacterium]|nr:OmpA family protein [Pseudomonadota bacterium]
MIKKREVETWIYSYADLVTNLLALFIMLFVLSNSSSKSRADFITGIEQYVKSKTYATGRIGTGQSELDDLHQLISQAIQKSDMSGQVNLTRRRTGIELTFESALVFDVGTAKLLPESLDILQQVASIASALPSKYFLIVEGHADSRPVNSGLYPSNWELSSARAGSVVRTLQSMGVASTRMRAVGYSDTKPIEEDKESDKNRRVVIKIDTEMDGGL